MADNIKKPRVTIAEVNRKHESLTASVHEMEVQLAALNEELNKHKGHRKHTSLGSLIAKLKVQVATTETTLNEAMSRLAAVESKLGNDFFTDRNMRDLEEVARKIALIDAIDDDLRELRGRVDSIAAEQAIQKVILDDHTGQLTEHEGRIDGHNVRLGVAEKDISSNRSDHMRLTNRVYNLEHVSKAAAGWAIVAGIVVALLVGWILWLQPPMTREETLSDGVTTVPITYTVLHDFGSWFIGAAVGLIVAGLIILFAKQKAKYEVRSESTMVQPAPNTLHREASGTPAGYPGAPSRNVTPDTAPTKVVQTSGAGSGA